jgi:hypothetical protein
MGYGLMFQWHFPRPVLRGRGTSTLLSTPIRESVSEFVGNRAWVMVDSGDDETYQVLRRCGKHGDNLPLSDEGKTKHTRKAICFIVHNGEK